MYHTGLYPGMLTYYKYYTGVPGVGIGHEGLGVGDDREGQVEVL